MRQFITVVALALNSAVCKATDKGCASGSPESGSQCLYCADADKCGMCKQGHFLNATAGTCTADTCSSNACTLGCKDADTCCTTSCNECGSLVGTCTSCLPGKHLETTCKDCDPTCVGACLDGTTGGCCPMDCAECEAASRSATHTCTLCFNGDAPTTGACGCATTTQNPKSTCVTCNSGKTQCDECIAKHKKVAGKCLKCDDACAEPVTCKDDGTCPAANETGATNTTTTSSGTKGVFVLPLLALMLFSK